MRSETVCYTVAMNLILLGLVVATEIFALYNRGGGPLLSHLVLTGAAFLCIAVCVFQRKKMRFKFTLAEAFYALFAVFFAVSLFFALTPEFGLSELLLFINAGILLVIFSNLNFGEKVLNYFSWALISIATADTMIGFFIYTRAPFPRLAGTFIDLSAPYASFGNDFANFLLLILPLAFFQLLRSHERLTTRILAVLSAAILFAGFLLTFSRGAWLSLLAVIILAGILWIVKRIKRVARADVAKGAWLGAAISVALAILLVAGLQFTRGQKFQTNSFLLKATMRADEETASVGERLNFWKGAIQIIKDKPVFGGGVLSFKFLYPEYQPDFGANWDHPHNIFLKIGVENGVPAAVFFALFLIFSAAAVLSAGHIGIFFIAGAVGAFGHNLVDYNFIVANFTLAIIFIAIGLSFAKKPKRPVGAKIPLGILAAVSLALVFIGIHDGYYNIYFKKGREQLANKQYDAAVLNLEKSQNLFWRRDLAHYLAIAYRVQYKQTGDPQWVAKEVKLLENLASKTIDAAVLSRLGELYVGNKRFTDTPAIFWKARNFFEQAFKLDPKNRLRYYYQLLSVRRAQNEPLDEKTASQTRALLAEYAEILKGNKHITILTDNPSYASQLYELLGMKAEKVKFDKIWFAEFIKFAEKYGKNMQIPIAL